MTVTESSDYKVLLLGGPDTSGGLAVQRQRWRAIIDAAFEAVTSQALRWHWVGGQAKTRALVPAANGAVITMPVSLRPDGRGRLEVALGDDNYMVVRPVSLDVRLQQLALVVIIMSARCQFGLHGVVLSPPISLSTISARG